MGGSQRGGAVYSIELLPADRARPDVRRRSGRAMPDRKVILVIMSRDASNRPGRAAGERGAPGGLLGPDLGLGEGGPGSLLLRVVGLRRLLALGLELLHHP